MHSFKLCFFCLLTFSFINATKAQTGITWTSQVSAADNSWSSVTYGNNLFVAVGFSGTGNRVMTSPDGVTWTTRTSAADNTWLSVAYGNGLFVVVGSVGTNRVMTSTDGINWTNRASADDTYQWNSVTYGNGLFVAVSTQGAAMTSTDGISWTLRSTGISNQWYSVTFANGLFVAVSVTGTGNRVMTSADGITWTSRTSAADNSWTSVTYGNSLFVAVSLSGTGNRVMTSPDGVTWTIRTSAADNAWRSVAYGNGLFVAVASTGTGNRVMTSSDGINWTTRTSAADNFWRSVTYSNGLFVAVGQTGTGNRVMTSGTFSPLPVRWLSFTAKEEGGQVNLFWQTANETNNTVFEIERSTDSKSFVKIGQVNAAGNSTSKQEYRFSDNAPSVGANYYRLKQVDVDGHYEYSKLVLVNHAQEATFSFYPNPVSGSLHLRGLQSGRTYTYIISNYSGQTVLTGILNENDKINVEHLPAGMYRLSVDAATKVFIKQ
jgi:hypothetical protein